MDSNAYVLQGSQETMRFNKFNDPALTSFYDLSWGMYDDVGPDIPVQLLSTRPTSLTNAKTEVIFFPISFQVDLETSLRVSAPPGFKWDVDPNAFFRRTNGTLEDWPTLPTILNQNQLVFNTLSLKGNTQYGFRAQADVPDFNPVIAANSFFIEFGYKSSVIQQRRFANVVEAPSIAALTNAEVYSSTNLEARRSLFDEPPAVEAVEPNEEKVDDMADKILEKIRRNYATLRTAFRALDRSNNGYISRVDFLDALEHIFINSGCTPEEIDAIAGRFGFGEGCADTLSYEEFCEAVGQVEEDPYEETMQNVEVAMEDRSDRQRIEEAHLAIQTFRQISDRRYASLRESFRALDKSRKSALSPAEFAHGLSMHGVNLKPEEMQDLLP
eukprot:symbB.v1.2.014739.t1/scaffold1019.1/size143789/2